MTESRLEPLWEAYSCAVHHLVTGPAGLREWLGDALAELRTCEAFCGLKRADAFEVQVLQDLPRLLETGERLDALAEPDLEVLALNVWRVQREVDAAFSHRAGVEMEQASA